MAIIPVILSGGCGSRLWPLSREAYPKPLLPLLQESSLFQNTVLRSQQLNGVTKPLVVCNEQHRFLVKAQMEQVGLHAAAIIVEPCIRNTAPAICLAALHSVEASDPVLLVMPADHIIGDVEPFKRAVNAAASFAEEGALVTFGITPRAPSERYGYIRAGKAMSGGACRVDYFIEKPKPAEASALIRAGNCYWNSGIFMFRASSYLKEIEKHDPQMLRACRTAMKGSRNDFGCLWPDASDFSAAPSNSVDCAVMEKTDRAVMVPVDMSWSDIGSWSAVWEAAPKDGHNNALRGDITCIDTKDSYLYSERNCVVALGLEDTIVVETADALLVAKKGYDQQLKDIIELRRAAGHQTTLAHRTVTRSWGSYKQLDAGPGFQIKRLTILPHRGISLQMHKKRSEHWVVVRGEATVTKGDKVMTLGEKESITIPVLTKHRLENRTGGLLEVIEVQSGSYLGEDDIVRFDDHYAVAEARVAATS